MTWTEDMLEGLGPDEYDFQEFKGSGFVLDEAGDLTPEFFPGLSKQLSAFANGGGGRIFLGLDDAGRIDGGIPVDLKGGGTRAWLEDVVNTLVDPALAQYNVHEVRCTGPGSHIRPRHAVYVLDVPRSELAPHQAIDHRYYLRIAGKSRPMGHVHIQDILARTRHPEVVVDRFAPYGPLETITSDPRGPKAMITWRVFLLNDSRRLAHHVGVEVGVPRPLVNREVRQRMLDDPSVRLTQRPGTVQFFRYHPNPVFPSQDLFFLQLHTVIHGGNLDAIRRDVARVIIDVYADDAPARTTQHRLTDYAVVREAIDWLDRQLSAR